MQLKDFNKLYFAFVLFHLAIIYRPDEVLFALSKLLLLSTLLVFYISKTKSSFQKEKWLISIALLFSLTGDALLINESETFFLAGMGAFAIAHIAYMIFFYMMRSGPMNTMIFILNAVLVIALMIALNYYVNVPSQLCVGINIYGLIIGLNLMSAVQFSYTNTFKSEIVPVGVFLFIISDLLLAVAKFNGSTLWLDLIVMLTYGLAQYLIVLGVLRYFKVSS